MLSEFGKKSICRFMSEQGFKLKAVDVHEKGDAAGFSATLCRGDRDIAKFFADGCGATIRSGFHEIASASLLAEFEGSTDALVRKYFRATKSEEGTRVVMACLLNSNDGVEVEAVKKSGKEVLALMPNGLQWAYKVSPGATRAALTARLIAEGAISIVGGEFEGQEICVCE